MHLIHAINRSEVRVLFLGDSAVFFVSLWVTLALRHGMLPSRALIAQHLTPFVLLFVVWVGTFFIAGLYEKHTRVFKQRLFGTAVRVQTINVLIAAAFFFLIPYFGITPKTILVIYLLVSTLLILFWRLWLFERLWRSSHQDAVIIGTGPELVELFVEVNENLRYGIHFTHMFDTADADCEEQLQTFFREHDTHAATVIVCGVPVAAQQTALERMLLRCFENSEVISFAALYEAIFDRVPLSCVEYAWFMEHTTQQRSGMYDALKRLMDISIALPFLLLSLLVYPFVIAARLLEGKGPVFITQERVGKNNTSIHIIKFGSMTGSDSGSEVLASKLEVTPVGSVLRVTRLDELPQLWNVLKGDMSLIGPRPELPAIVAEYEKALPLYHMRHMVTPGLSGWAQMYHAEHPHHGTAVEQTRDKLSYDLYYLKHRSFTLDVIIALKTIKTLLSRSGV